MNKIFKNITIYLLIVLVAVSFYQWTSPFEQGVQTLKYDQFMGTLENEEITEVNILSGDNRYIITGSLADGSKFEAVTPNDPEIINEIENQEISVSFDKEPGPPWWMGLLSTLLPILILVGIFIFMINQTQGGGSKVMQFGKSKAKLQTDETKKVTFDDVAGADEEKEELNEVVEFLKMPRKFTQLGAKIPKGILLFGPPGTGKTLLAKAVAGEAEVPFFTISGSDFVEMFVGVGASRVRDLFEQAKKNAPCIIFIDEIDAVGRQRGAGLGGGHDEREQTLNQLLVEMDGFAVNEGIIVIAGTNRPDILDPALLRPGRFDRQIMVGIPDIKGREEILKVHAKGKPLADDIDMKVLARRTPGFTGADLANALNEAALLSARLGNKKIHMAEMEAAIERVLAGPEKKSRVISDSEKKLVSYHEAGHAIAAYHLPNTDPLHKISIIPRGRAGGYTLLLPEEDRNYVTKSRMLDEVVTLLGGRVAEKIILKEISTGAQNDLERATDIVRKMIMQYGMSEELGSMTFGQQHEQVFLGRDISQEKNYSEEIAYAIDKESRNMIDTAYAKVEKILKDNIEELHAVAQYLMKHEVMEAEEFLQVVKAVDQNQDLAGEKNNEIEKTEE